METDGSEGMTNGGRPRILTYPTGGQTMMNAKQKTLKLVTEQIGDRGETNHCDECADMRRQLEHIRMCLQATLLAAQPRTAKPKYKRPS